MIVGFAAGLLSGLGIGGGTLLLIWLTTFAGVEQTAAQGINLIYFLPCAAAALYSHFRNGEVDRAVLIPAAAAGAFTAPVFAWLANAADTGLLRRGFGVFLIAAGLYELFRKGD